MEIRFDGKTALVTGGAGGIGCQTAELLLDSGAAVAVADVSKEALKRAQEKLAGRGKCIFLPVNIADPESVRQCVENVLAQFGRIDVLVQTAGVLRSRPAEQITEEDWDFVLNINAKGMFFMMQQTVLQSMQYTGGSIVNFASMAGIRGMRREMAAAHYAASKGAVVAMSMQAATEWAHYGIRCNAVAPGGVLTDAMLAMKKDTPDDPHAMDPIPLRKLSRPEDIAEAVTFLASDRASMITGQTLVIDGGSSIVGY